tara:strand:+ start:21589 stop:22257 length:669 start_codon:yes stop_codon:yes gene_type:complete
MEGMNNFFYTFKDGQLYKHYSNATRNNYYGINYNSTITTIFNASPTEAKMFKTLELESTDSWTANILTDMDRGQIDSAWFQLKEGDYYAYIRRYTNMQDLDLLSAQGIGNNSAVSAFGLSGVKVDFSFDIGNIVSDGDVLYREFPAGTIQEIGTITDHDSTSVTVATKVNTPSGADFMLFLKSSLVESYGARGYFMEVQLTNTSTTGTELFSIGSEVFKSFP